MIIKESYIVNQEIINITKVVIKRKGNGFHANIIVYYAAYVSKLFIEHIICKVIHVVSALSLCTKSLDITVIFLSKYITIFQC